MTRHRYRDPVARPPKVDHRTWFVLVALPAAHPDSVKPLTYALGPAGSWSRARELSDAWERQHGPGTAPVRERVPKLYVVVRRGA